MAGCGSLCSISALFLLHTYVDVIRSHDRRGYKEHGLWVRALRWEEGEGTRSEAQHLFPIGLGKRDDTPLVALSFDGVSSSQLGHLVFVLALSQLLFVSLSEEHIRKSYSFLGAPCVAGLLVGSSPLTYMSPFLFAFVHPLCSILSAARHFPNPRNLLGR